MTRKLVRLRLCDPSAAARSGTRGTRHGGRRQHGGPLSLQPRFMWEKPTTVGVTPRSRVWSSSRSDTPPGNKREPLSARVS
jgi:hypothetical protein